MRSKKFRKKRNKKSIKSNNKKKKTIKKNKIKRNKTRGGMITQVICPLFKAIENNDLKAIEVILNNGINNINCIDNEGKTPFMRILEKQPDDKLQMVELMIIAGAKIDHELSNYNLNKDNEAHNNILELLEAIIFANKKLIEAVEEDKNIEDVKDALANFAQINFKNNDGKTALELALSKENSKENDEIIKYLEDNGGNASNTKDLIISFEKRIENITKRAEEENNKTQGDIELIEKTRIYAYDLLKRIKLLDEDIGGNISEKLIEFYNDLKKLRSPFDFVKQIRDEEKLFRNSLIDDIKQHKIYKIKDESKIDELLKNINYIITDIESLNSCEQSVTKFIDIILYKESVNPNIKNYMLWKSINARKDEYKRQINIIREEDNLLIQDNNIIPFWTSKINNLKKHSNYKKIEDDFILNTNLYFIRGDELVYNDIFMDEIEKFKLPPQIYVSDFIQSVEYDIINIIKKILDTNKDDIKDKLDIALRTVIADKYKNTNDIIRLLVDKGANVFQKVNNKNLEDLSNIDDNRKKLILDLKKKYGSVPTGDQLINED